jgi:hypothetical protein
MSRMKTLTAKLSPEIYDDGNEVVFDKFETLNIKFWMTMYLPIHGLFGKISRYRYVKSL